MSDLNREERGAIIQAYARARWGTHPDDKAAEHLGAQLDPALRDRIDTLGLDAERLLTVAPSEALDALQGLEREAALEDKRARAAATRTRTQEEARIQGPQSHRPAQAPRRDARKHAGPQRQSGRQGRGRQRGQR